MGIRSTIGANTTITRSVLLGADGYEDERANPMLPRMGIGRDVVLDLLGQVPGLKCHKPEGAFYVFPNVAGCLGKTTPKGKKLETDTDFVTTLLEERHVATVQEVMRAVMKPNVHFGTIPGTDKPQYMLDNLNAGRGRMPDAAMRRTIEKWWETV